MAKITRYSGNLKPFASNSTGLKRTVFGDVTQADDIDSNITPDFLLGWESIGDETNNFPTLQDFNALGYTHGQLLAYLHQMGIPEWSGVQEYHSGSVVNLAGVLYVCQTNSHVSATAPNLDATNWKAASQANVDSIADLRLLPPGTGPVQALGYYAPGDGGGGPLRVTKAAPVGGLVDNGGSILAYNGAVGTAIAEGELYWGWEWSGAVNVKWFGAKGDGVADDTSQLLNFFAHPAGIKTMDQGAVYVTDSQLEMISDTIIYMNGATIKATDFGSGFRNGYTSAVKTIVGYSGVENAFIVGGTLDGNSAVFGGRNPDANTGVYGVLAWINNTNVGAINCRSIDCSASGFSHLSNGSLGQSKDVLWDSCYTDFCGLGFSQEILFAGGIGTGGMDFGLSPGKTTYLNCKADINNNFGVYFSGGDDISAKDCSFANTRNDTLTLYTGDAHGVLNVNFDNCTFDSTARANSNFLAKIHSVNTQVLNTENYLKASKLKAVFDDCTFIGSDLYDQKVRIEKNSDVTFNGGKIETSRVLAVDAIVGATGVITNPVKLNTALFYDFSVDYPLAPDFPVLADKCTFSSTLKSKAIFLSNIDANDSIFSNCIFGLDRTGELLEVAYTIPVADLRLTSYNNNFTNMVGAATQFSVTIANASYLTTYGNSPKNATFEQRFWRRASSAPISGTWTRGDFIWNLLPTVSVGKILIGWSCVVTGTPGTWEPCYVTNT